jgi:DNA-directed RNA polymerase subunit M/transcription elongation factor TFIIS
MFIGSILTVAAAAAPLFTSAQTCCAAGNAAKKEGCPAVSSKLKATGAVVLESNGTKTKIQIVCGKCGYKAAALEIDTPTAGKPYTQDWTCPKCNFKQKVTVELVTA